MPKRLPSRKRISGNQMILFVKSLLFSLVLLSNIFHLQAFTFNMYSGRGIEVTIEVLNKNNQSIQKSDLFERGYVDSLLFLAERTAQEYCGITGAKRILLDQKKFKSYEC